MRSLNPPSDTTSISLIYANVNAEDILLKTDVNNSVEGQKNGLKINYVLNNTPAGYDVAVGLCSREMIRGRLPNAGEGVGRCCVVKGGFLDWLFGGGLIVVVGYAQVRRRYLPR